MYAIDQRVFDFALAIAIASGATSPGTFATTVGTEAAWIFKVNEFKKYLSKGSMNIFAKTLRGRANVIVAGVNVASVIEQLSGFEAANLGQKMPAGPYVMGRLGNYTVICNPFYDADTYLEGFRGDNWLYGGICYAPYLPMYQTNPVELATFNTQQGFMSMAAITDINAGMFTYGYISGY